MQGGMKNDDFRPISRCISETVIVRWAYAARQFVSIEFSPLGGFPSEYRLPLWDGKTRMVSLPDGEEISKICLFVLT